MALSRPVFRALAGRFATVSARAPLATSCNRLALPRGFSTEGATKVVKCLAAEIKYEQDQYEQPKEIKEFMKKTDFKLVDTEGDVNMMLERDAGNKVVRIEWQLASPFAPDMIEEDGEGEAPEPTPEFSVTIENKEKGSGIVFYCQTLQHDDSANYMIGNVRCYKNTEERDSQSAYNGPDFEDVDDKLQEAFDEYLAEAGVSKEVCDFIAATALDKEQREYLRWLQLTKDVLS